MKKRVQQKFRKCIYYYRQAVLSSQVSIALRSRALAATIHTELSPTHTWALSSLTSPETRHTGRLIHYDLISFGHAVISDRGRHATRAIQPTKASVLASWTLKAMVSWSILGSMPSRSESLSSFTRKQRTPGVLGIQFLSTLFDFPLGMVTVPSRSLAKVSPSWRTRPHGLLGEEPPCPTFLVWTSTTRCLLFSYIVG